MRQRALTFYYEVLFMFLIAHSVVHHSQTAFMPDRNILEGVVILHETLHEIHTKKLDGVVFKVDFEKAYDKVKWPFLQQALRMKGFDEAWRRQVESFTQKGSVGIKVNDDIGHYFQTHKGLRQGDPMSPILFNIVVDMLALRPKSFLLIFSRSKHII
jgi:hypothetical protein